jgi:hypothetical protein
MKDGGGFTFVRKAAPAKGLKAAFADPNAAAT